VLHGAALMKTAIEMAIIASTHVPAVGSNFWAEGLRHGIACDVFSCSPKSAISLAKAIWVGRP